MPVAQTRKTTIETVGWADGSTAPPGISSHSATPDIVAIETRRTRLSYRDSHISGRTAMVRKGEASPLWVAETSSTIATRKRTGGQSCRARASRCQGAAVAVMNDAAIPDAPPTASDGRAQEAIGMATNKPIVAVIANGANRRSRPTPTSGPCGASSR
jgi:hypothetical protein